MAGSKFFLLLRAGTPTNFRWKPAHYILFHTVKVTRFINADAWLAGGLAWRVFIGFLECGGITHLHAHGGGGENKLLLFPWVLARTFNIWIEKYDLLLWICRWNVEKFHGRVLKILLYQPHGSCGNVGPIINEKLPEKIQDLQFKGNKNELPSRENSSIRPTCIKLKSVRFLFGKTAMNITEVDSAFRP